MTGEDTNKSCLACGRDETRVPLIRLEYRGAGLWICPQHLPVLSHDPRALAGRLPGAEDLSPADSRD